MYVHLLASILQVNMHRLHVINRIEAKAEQLRQSGAAVTWLKEADPMVAEVHFMTLLHVCMHHAAPSYVTGGLRSQWPLVARFSNCN